MRFSVPQRGQRGLGGGHALAPQIHHAEHRASRPRHRLLGSVRQEPRSEHRMSLDEIGHRALQPHRVDCAAVEFDVQMGRHPAQFLLVGSTDPVGVLHRSQRERRVFDDRRFRLGRRGRRGRRLSAEQGVPRVDGGVGRQLGKGDGGAAFTPAAGHRHHPDGVQSQLDEIVMVCDVFGRAAELGRDRGLDLVPADLFLAEHV